MQKTAVITGGGTGLGQALAKALALRNLHVVIIGRRLEKLQQTAAFFPDQIITICADVSKASGRKLIAKILARHKLKIDYLIHNAAIVRPILALEKLSLSAFRQIQAINLEGPLFLTQILYPFLNSPARILHISSDCARTALANWIPYCISKAGLHMLYECLKKEFQQTCHSRAVYIASIDPGMMDTPMQQYICSNKTAFPEKIKRKALIQQGLLLPPAFSAQLCVKLLLDISPDSFSRQEWRAYDELNKDKN